MKAIFGITATITLALSLLSYSIFKDFVLSELDLANYVHARASRLVITDLYPKLTKASLSSTRSYNSLLTTSKYVWGGEINRVEFPRDDLSNISVRIYFPTTANTTDKLNDTLLPVIMWLHGGGFVLGSAAIDDNKCILLSKLSGFLIVSVDYRLAPGRSSSVPTIIIHAGINY